jgi:hypothetical protein
MRPGVHSRHTVRTALACLLALAAALALASCGGSSSDTNAQSATGGPTPAEIAASPASQVPKAKPGTPSLCQVQLGHFVDSMNTLRRRLVVGLDYQQYVVAMKKVRGEYEGVPADEVELGCLRAAGTAAERGLNLYIEANNTWTDCVETAGCESASIEGALQAKWKEASEYLSKAQRGLSGQSPE